MNKEKYISCEWEIILFQTEDVIMTTVEPNYEDDETLIMKP